MSYKYGGIVFTGARKEYECEYCKEFIQPKTVNALRVGSKHGIYFNTRLHPDCLFLSLKKALDTWVESGMDKRLGARENSGPRDTKLKNIPDEVKRRRAALLFYLNTRDKKSLTLAYKEHRTDRVFKVMSNIYKRLLELHEMKISFPLSFINKPGECRDLIAIHDSEWLWKVSQAPDTLEKYSLFLRAYDVGPQPAWNVIIPEPTSIDIEALFNEEE